LVEQHLGGSGPLILYNLDGSSSPFKGRRRFARWLHWQRFEAKLVKMPTDCERLYDLLGLYERADLLITTDTATLWLAHAVHIPTIVLHQTDTWCRAPFPPATILGCTYEGAHSRRRAIAEAIRNCLASPRRQPVAACV
jgi:hypothetical protein